MADSLVLRNCQQLIAAYRYNKQHPIQNYLNWTLEIMEEKLAEIFKEIKGYNFNLVNFTHFYGDTLPAKLTEAIILINKINPEEKKQLFNRGFYIQLLALIEFCEVETENVLLHYEQKLIHFKIAKIKLLDFYARYIVALHAYNIKINCTGNVKFSRINLN